MLSKVYLCPSDKKYGCTWEGSSDDIFEHFSQEHEDLLYFTGSININLDVPSENRLLLVDTEIYLLQTKINDDCLNIYLRYLGPPKIAANLSYDIDLSANGMKMGKQDIEMRNGFFSVALECIKTCFGDVDTISCHLLVSGDFTVNSSSDSVFIESESPDKNIMEIEDTSDLLQIQKSEEDENIKDLSPNLREFFSTPKEGNSPIESQETSHDLLAILKEENSPVDKREQIKFNFDESSRATWYATESDSPKERTTFLSRSQTFSSDDAKRNNSIKRHASMRSLSSIAESDLDSELQCSNCESHLAAPIFLCVSGHNICTTCYRDNNLCSVCDKETTADRNQDLEEKALNYVYSCINKRNGCPKKLLYREIGDHETNCTFCNYLCPMESCGYKAGYKNMICHLNLIHSSVKIFQTFIAIFQKYQELFLVNETMGIFYCSWIQLDNKVLWRVKFCGPKARKFFCELKFKGKNFKKPLLLTKHDDIYFKEMGLAEIKEQKVKPKHSILTITW